MTVMLASVVTGHGEVTALPVLLRRIAGEVAPSIAIECPRPVRVPEGRIGKPAELERAARLASRRLVRPGGVIVLLDADDDSACPASRGPELLSVAQKATGGAAVSVVLAKREFESWFLAAAESLRGVRGLRVDLAAPFDPEGVRGAKEWLSDRKTDGFRYRETSDQAALAAQFDLATARRRSPSFAKLCRDVRRLLGLAGSQEGTAAGEFER